MNQRVLVQSALRELAKTHFLSVTHNVFISKLLALVCDGGPIKILTTNVYTEIVHVRYFLFCQYGEGSSLLPISRSSSSPMYKQLHARWEIVVNHIVKKGNVDTAGCQVRNYKEAYFLESELLQALLSCPLVHRSIDKGALEACMRAKLIEVFHVVASCTKDNRLVLWSHKIYQLSHDIQQGCCLFPRPHDHEVEFEVVREL